MNTTKQKLNGLKFLIIAAALLWSLPALADEVTTTPEDTSNETVSSTPPVEIPSSTPEAVPTPSSTIIIRYQDQIIFNGNIELTSTVYHDDINNVDYQLDPHTVFSALALADEQSENFDISNAQNGLYGFYLDCITVATSSTPAAACSNWNYVVNNTYPSVGMNDYILHGGETVYIYFSSPWKITATTSTFPLGTTTTLETWRYQFDNITEPWVFDPNNILDIAVPNPASTGWWDTTIVVTTTQTNTSGTVDYNFTATGTYTLNFHDFTKWSPITISVLDPATTTAPEEPPTGGGGGNTNQAVSQDKINETVNKLINFIKSKQETDGKIIDGGTSDWLAMTFAADNIYTANVKSGTASLYDYIYNYSNTELENELNSCAAYPRHILALLASGMAKTDTKINALKNKLDACVQNNNFGANGINDDVFGLIAALAIGEDQSSATVQTTLGAIQTNQQADGGFAYPGTAPFESPDITGVAINALKYAQNNGLTVDPIIFSRAKQYLKTQQLTDGGWGCYDYPTCAQSDVLTTSWAVMGINALAENQDTWFNTAGKNPWHVLTALDNDHYSPAWGGIDWFATKHAVPALLGKFWPLTLSPASVSGSSGGGTSTSVPTSTISTSTIDTGIITTTTPTTSTLVLTTSTEPTILPIDTEDEGEILGIKIENTAAPARTISAASVDASSVATEENEDVQTAAKQPEPAEQNQIAKETTEVDKSGLSARDWAKRILLISVAGALVIAIFIGSRKLKK